MIRIHLVNGEKVDIDNVNIVQIIDAINDGDGREVQYLTINNAYVFLWKNISYIEDFKYEDN